MEDALLSLFLRAAQACILVQDRCRHAERYCAERAAGGYTVVARTCGKCNAACRKLADLCLSKDLGVYIQALDCATKCEVCAEECAGLHDPQLRALIDACREAAVICRKLAQETWEERQKLLPSPLPTGEEDPGEGDQVTSAPATS